MGNNAQQIWLDESILNVNVSGRPEKFKIKSGILTGALLKGVIVLLTPGVG